MLKKLNIIFIVFFISTTVSAEDSKLKFRGSSNNKQKTISIDLEMFEVKKLNKNLGSYKMLKSSAKFIDKNFKEGPLFRGGVYGK